ncbi:MotA/TolQ/ExbB proton channel family protein [Alcanivorax sp. REN37]|uniref:MotA/TolQ/ExbB proton channel family protein n=1 Tax=Isoalcanivorax beigongshangi TaxID=3238810 RepID=A0ABV4AJ52_9GAMM
MLEIVIAGGWMMAPILLSMALAMAIVGERFWSLRPGQLAPAGLLGEVQASWRPESGAQYLQALRSNSALGRVLAAALASPQADRQQRKERMEEAASQEIHDMEKFLNVLGTVANIAPLLGLLGTVFGMIAVFSAIMLHGSGDTGQLAGGISEALITTAAGLIVAIPAMFFYRFFLRRVDEIAVRMEQNAVALLDWLDRSGPEHGAAS